MELWDTDFVDMLEPAYITFEAKGGGEFVFGAVRGDLDCRYGPDGNKVPRRRHSQRRPTQALSGARQVGPHGLRHGQGDLRSPRNGGRLFRRYWERNPEHRS